MIVTAVFHGALADWLGTPSADFDLPEAAAVADLFQAIGRRFGSVMPPGLWDENRRTFRVPVAVRRTGRSLVSDSFPPEDGDRLDFFLELVGG
jgi:hypothetical protein